MTKFRSLTIPDKQATGDPTAKDGGMSLTRRQLLGAAGAAGALAATGKFTSATRADAATRATLPRPAESGIDHIVVLCMENRSFDHYLGWVPGAVGRQRGLTYLDDGGAPHKTHRLTEWTGCGFNDPDHSYDGGRVQFDGGALDGFRKGDNDDFALGYYTEADLPTMSQLVENFTVCDHWFASILGPTYPNRLYTHSAATDRISNTMDTSTLPTIWDRLGAAGVSANYYFHDLPVLALYGTKYVSLSRPFHTFFAQAALGQLPSYTYLDPSFLGEGQGTTNDDHPHADIRRGQALIAQVVQALTTSPTWEKTLLIVTYDEWGGFFDHVAPPRLPDAVDNPGGDSAHPDHAQAGFRVPSFIVSPFAAKGKVAHRTLDHSAILRLVEWRFGLAPVSLRDAASANIAQLLDFSAPNRVPPTIAVPADPGPHLCAGGVGAAPSGPSAMGSGLEGETFWQEMAASPLMKGWGGITT